MFEPIKIEDVRQELVQGFNDKELQDIVDWLNTPTMPKEETEKAS